MIRCYSIMEFCEAHGISRELFYKLARENLAPKSFHIGQRRLISEEAASEWRNFMSEKHQAPGGIQLSQERGS